MDYFKPTYTKEEADEMVKWINEHHPTGSFDLGEGVLISDVALFCQRMKTIIQRGYNNPAYAGQICVFVNFQKAWKEKDV